VPLDTFRNYGEYNDYPYPRQGAGLSYNAGNRPISEYAPPYEPTKLPGYGTSFTEHEPDKKNSDEDRDLAGVDL
jgi:hypothetical protein